MDVYCSTCDEPWDTYHLQHEAIHETDLDFAEAQAWPTLPAKDKLNARLREKFAAAGWEFGNSVLNVRHCPCCPKDAQPDPERDAAKRVLESMLGEDEDGLAVTFEDFAL